MTAAELGEQIRAAKPIAPEGLRERVRSVAAARPAAQRSFLPRIAFPRARVLLPVAAAGGLVAVAAAAVIGLVRPQAEPPVVAAQKQVLGPATIERSVGTPGVAGTGAAAPPRTGVHQGAPLAGTTHLGASPAPTPGRAQDYEAQLGIEVKNGDALSDATKRAMTIARNLGGYVVSASYASAESGSASLTLRVPTARVQDAIAQLTSLGRITSQQVQIQDLQEQLDELDREIVVLRARIAHLTALLASPSLTAERRAQLQAQRDELQGALRRLRQSRAGTAQQAAFATVQLQLQTKAQTAAPVPSRLHRTLHEAVRILALEAVALLYALVVVGPLAVLAILAWLAARTRRRAEERRLLARTD